MKGEYVKFANSEGADADGTTVRIFLNGEEKKWMGGEIQGKFGDDRTKSFDETYEVKAGDILIFAVNPEGNDSYDGGKLSVTITEAETGGETEPVIEEVEPDPNRTNNTTLAGSFTDKQGNDGWYYGSCDWDSTKFAMIPYDTEKGGYFYKTKPELKKDFVEPGNGRNAAYKWVVAKDGTIKVKGEYVKFANSEGSDADGTCVRIFLNGVEKKWMGGEIQGKFSNERSVSFDETYEVKAGDILIFAVNPEGNDSYDGGRLSVTITGDEVSSVGMTAKKSKATKKSAKKDDKGTAPGAANGAAGIAGVLPEIKKEDNPQESTAAEHSTEMTESAADETKKEEATSTAAEETTPEAAEETEESTETAGARETRKPEESAEADSSGERKVAAEENGRKEIP